MQKECSGLPPCGVISGFVNGFWMGDTVANLPQTLEKNLPPRGRMKQRSNPNVPEYELATVAAQLLGIAPAAQNQP